MPARRWFARRYGGVEDLTKGELEIPEHQRRAWILHTIDEAPFQVWVVFVAGVGFLVDAYNLFALNAVIPMIGYVYYPETGEIPQRYQAALLIATLGGTMIGQVVFGILADSKGRRKMYGTELVLEIVGTLLLTMSSSGEKGSMMIMPWLITWRFVMGLGIGADYPLSAVITSEFAPRVHRLRMLCWVFFMQPFGQLLAAVVSLITVAGWKQWITKDDSVCRSDECIRAIDAMWRLIVGLGTVPAVLALAFRLGIPESPRFKLDVKKKFKSASKDTWDYFGNNNTTFVNDLQRTGALLQGQRAQTQPVIYVEEEESDDEAIFGQVSPGLDVPLRDVSPGNTVRPILTNASSQTVDPLTSPASWQDFKDYFFRDGNWRYLLGTSLCWAELDFAFYGLGLYQSTLIRYVWYKEDQVVSLYQSLQDNATHYMLMVSLGAVIGGALMIKIVKHVSTRTIQLWGFVVLFILFMILGSAWKKLMGGQNQIALVILYALCQIFFYFGPNTTTFIIPAELFPTKYRCTCHGISAAAGKLGSILAQVLMVFAFRGDKEQERKWFGIVLQILSVFMILGAATTWWLIPETRDSMKRSRPLEELAKGRETLEKLHHEVRQERQER